MEYTKLSVNINKFALVRNARGYLPDILKIAQLCETFGADGITIHPRPDERHITKKDVYDLKKIITKEYNIEGYPTEDFIKMVCEVKPTQVTLVPDAPQQLTSDHGWDIIKNESFLQSVITTLHQSGCSVSIFVDTESHNLDAAKRIAVDSIELYTGAYSQDPEVHISRYKTAANHARDIGLKVNAGHDLNLNNLALLKQNIPFLSEVSIGQALVCDAWILGLDNTINLYKRLLTLP